MIYFKKGFCLIVSILLFSCQGSSQKKVDASEKDYTLLEDRAVAYFASGCFWCVEAIFQHVKGVEEAISGYAGGEIPNPTYREVSRGQTKHAEAVKVIYNPQQVDFNTLVKVFFGSHDPTTPNRQGPDRGSQYRSIAFYQNEEEKQIIKDYIEKLEKEAVYSSPIVTEVKPLEHFYEAEDYHQEYERLHPDDPYVQNVSLPRLKRFQEKYPELLKSAH
jgi:peptide-methionine (S)-S-oxide reductase